MGRKHRIAKKIVSRFQRDPAGTLGYSLEQITEAHRHTGATIDKGMVAVWQAARNVYAAKAKAEALANQAKAEARRAAKAERILTGLPETDKALEGGTPLGRVTELHGMEHPGPAPDPIPEVEVNVLVEPVEATEKTIDFSATDEPLPEYEAMSVTDLRAECKARGLSGYSKLAKPDLIAKLQEHDG